ncbi:asparaginase [Candidatus Peregrinibacteria bacterium]|nr:asparaginase [Candidatus Peregrinibacteria bacterium]
MPRPKIAILYVGGSIGMVRNQKTGRIEALESVGDFYRYLPDIQKEVSLEFFSLANVGSSEVTPGHWVQIAKTIREQYDACEGFVVIHGTNTMSYTAAALSFALRDLSKPIVLTGSLLPINDVGSDGRMNLVFAVRAALLDIAEVCIVLGPKVLRGCRAKKAQQSRKYKTRMQYAAQLEATLSQLEPKWGELMEKEIVKAGLDECRRTGELVPISDIRYLCPNLEEGFLGISESYLLVTHRYSNLPATYAG